MSVITDIELEAMLFVRHLTLAAQHRTDADLDRSAYAILACLYGGGEMSLAELSETLNLDVSTVSRQTAAMIKGGLLEKILDPAGRTARLLRATALGDVRLREACEANIRMLQDATAGWSAAELRSFAHCLRKLNVAFERSEGTPWPRLASAANRQPEGATS